MEKEIIGDATLYLGDSRELMASWEEGSVDHIITDVPYHNRTHSNAKTNKAGAEEFIDFSSISGEEFATFFAEFLRVSLRWVVSTCDFQHIPLLYDWPEFVRHGIWVKPNPTPQISGDRPGQGFEAVAILHREGRKRWNGGGKAGTWSVPVARGALYPTEKPLSLLSHFVHDFTDVGETIFDPCMGRATTGVAAVTNGRKFIGCEIRRVAFDLACKRIEDELKQGQLFH